MKRIRTVRADFTVGQPVGMAHFDVNLIFHPPSLKNPTRIPTDDPMETSNKFLDKFKRTSIDTFKYRMELLRHATPTEAPYTHGVNVEQHMAIRLPFFTASRQRGRRG